MMDNMQLTVGKVSRSKPSSPQLSQSGTEEISCTINSAKVDDDHDAAHRDRDRGNPKMKMKMEMERITERSGIDHNPLTPSITPSPRKFLNDELHQISVDCANHNKSPEVHVNNKNDHDHQQNNMYMSSSSTPERHPYQSLLMVQTPQRHPFQSPVMVQFQPPPVRYYEELEYKQQQQLMVNKMRQNRSWNNSTLSHKSYNTYDNNEFNSDSTTNFGHNDVHLPPLSDHHFSNYGDINNLPLALAPNPRQISITNSFSSTFNLTPSGFRYESVLKWYCAELQDYIDVGGILCDKQLFIVPIKQYLIWKEFEERSQINYILEDLMTSLIQKNDIDKIIKN